MPATTPCNPCCSTPTTTNVPGSAGAAAFTSTTASFVIPAADANVTIAVLDTSWMGDGLNLYIGGANFKVNVGGVLGPTSVSVKFLNFDGDTAAGSTVAGGSLVRSGVGGIDLPLSIANGGTSAATAAGARTALGLGAAALLADPIPVANGGTGSATKALAQTALGLGQSVTAAYVTGLTQDITAVATLVAGASITPAAAGKYLIYGRITVDIAGATFAGSRVVTAKLRNVTGAADLTNGTATKNTQIITTTSYPSFDWIIGPVEATLTAAQQIQIFVSISVVPSAGTIRVTEAVIVAEPIAQS